MENSTNIYRQLTDEADALGIADINLSIENILATPKGSQVARPQFGSNHSNCLDKPLDEAKLCLIEEINQAISEFEPRIQTVSFDIKIEETSIFVKIKYKLNDGLNTTYLHTSFVGGI